MNNFEIVKWIMTVIAVGMFHNVVKHHGLLASQPQCSFKVNQSKELTLNEHCG